MGAGCESINTGVTKFCMAFCGLAVSLAYMKKERKISMLLNPIRSILHQILLIKLD